MTCKRFAVYLTCKWEGVVFLTFCWSLIILPDIINSNNPSLFSLVFCIKDHFTSRLAILCISCIRNFINIDQEAFWDPDISPGGLSNIPSRVVITNGLGVILRWFSPISWNGRLGQLLEILCLSKPTSFHEAPRRHQHHPVQGLDAPRSQMLEFEGLKQFAKRVVHRDIHLIPPQGWVEDAGPGVILWIDATSECALRHKERRRDLQLMLPGELFQGSDLLNSGVLGSCFRLLIHHLPENALCREVSLVQAAAEEKSVKVRLILCFRLGVFCKAGAGGEERCPGKHHLPGEAVKASPAHPCFKVHSLVLASGEYKSFAVRN